MQITGKIKSLCVVAVFIVGWSAVSVEIVIEGIKSNETAPIEAVQALPTQSRAIYLAVQEPLPSEPGMTARTEDVQASPVQSREMYLAVQEPPPPQPDATHSHENCIPLKPCGYECPFRWENL